jgi:putative ABC transport system permease protein
MKLMIFALKNALRNWWRTIILGIFIFLIGFITTFMGSFSLTMRNQMEDAIINGLSGHIQIRASEAAEDDFAEQLKSRWKGAALLDAQVQNRIGEVLKAYQSRLVFTPRVRHAGLFISDKDKTTSLIIGLDPQNTNFQDALILSQGRMLDPAKSHEVIITESLAEKLKIRVGDRIGVLSQTKDGYPVDMALTVAGVAQYRMLSLFAFSCVYTDIATARELIGYYQNQVSDIILYVNKKSQTEKLYSELAASFSQAGIPVAESGSGPNPKQGIKLSTYKSMGGFFMGTVSGMTFVFFFLIILLLVIVSILIANLVYMMGIERYKEIGTLRAIGFSRSQTLNIFLTEIQFITGFFGLLGIALATILCIYFSIVGLPSPSPSMDYLMGKKLFFQIDFWQLIGIFYLLDSIIFTASFFPANKACSLRPVETLKE